MKKGKIIALIVAACLVVSGAVIGGLSFAGMGFDLHQLQPVQLETTERPVADSFRTIRIESQISDVILLPSTDGACTVTTCLPQRVTCTVSVTDGTLTVRETDERQWFDHLAVFGYKDADIRIALPIEAYNALYVSSDVGDVQAPADFMFGQAQITTDTGDVDLSAAVQGALSVETQTGDIALSRTEPQNVTVQTDTGKIAVADVHASDDAAITTQTGDVALSDTTCRTLSLDSDTGDAALQNVIAQQDMRITTDTGDVTLRSCDAAELAINSDTGDIDGTLRTDKIFLATSVTGKIQVPESVAGGKCVIRTVTGDVIMTVVTDANPE